MTDEEMLAEMRATRAKVLMLLRCNTDDGREPLSADDLALAEICGITQDDFAEARSPSGMVAARDPEP